MWRLHDGHGQGPVQLRRDRGGAPGLREQQDERADQARAGGGAGAHGHKQVGEDLCHH